MCSKKSDLRLLYVCFSVIITRVLTSASETCITSGGESGYVGS